MSIFYFTFGQQYRHEPHPCGGHPDGWFGIEAEGEGEARDKMFELAGPKWAMQYDKEPSKAVFPRGEIRRIKA